MKNRLARTDCILICVPTPLTSHQGPEMAYIKETVLLIYGLGYTGVLPV